MAESIAKPTMPEPNMPKSSPAMPAPTTPPMTWEACASEFAAGSPSAGTMCGSIAARAGRKNVPIGGLDEPEDEQERDERGGLDQAEGEGRTTARSRSAASMTRRRSQRST